MLREDLPEGVTRETMEVDILIVGGGAAGLSAALQAHKTVQAHNAAHPEQTPLEPMIMVIEKAREMGAHSLSGAVLNPVSLQELIPDYVAKGCPISSEVTEDAVYYLTKNSAIKAPITPPPFRNHGNVIIQLAKFNRWLAAQCEEKGINVFPGFAAVDAIYEGDRIVGVRTGDKGRDKNGDPKPNFEPGLVLRAKVVIFAEGTRGSLFKQVAQKLHLRDGKNPEVFEEGVKEVVQMPPGTVKPGQVIHTLGFPLHKSIGGTFIYTLPKDQIIIGLVAYLDTKDPLLDPHRELQKLKTHPWMQAMLKDGQVIAYGGKTLPAGGYYSIPQLYGDGWMVVGDSASLVDVQKLKGIHLAMKSGMCAGQSAAQALIAGDSSRAQLASYEKALRQSFVEKELYRVRNFHQTLSKGVFTSLPFIALQELTGGRGLTDKMSTHADSSTTAKVQEVWGEQGLGHPDVQLPRPDGKLFYDKLSSVYLTGTLHDEDSPNHLLLKKADICRTVCEPEYKSPCTHFCPASVYEMIPSTEHANQKELKINFTNCIHCKTCDIKCPFENIDWTVPEGGGGPQYVEV